MATPLKHTLRVVAEECVSRPHSGLGRYTHDLVLLLLMSSPMDFEIDIVSAAHANDGLASALARMPGIAGFQSSFLGERALRALWSAGIPFPVGYGMTHASSLFAPTIPHDPVNDPGSQLVVTLHDLSPWSGPRREWGHWIDDGLLRRAWRHADAVIVPTHAMADRVHDIRNFGSRVHVITPAMTSPLWRQARLDGRPTPSHGHTRVRAGDTDNHTSSYVLVAAEGADLETLGSVARAVHNLDDVRLVILGDGRASTSTLTAVLADTHHLPSRVSVVPWATSERYAQLVTGAMAVIEPRRHEVRAQTVIDALSVGTPVITADSPGLVELAGDAALTVAAKGRGLDESALTDLLRDTRQGGKDVDRRSRLGLDMSSGFHPLDTGRRIWRLHGDLSSY